MSASKAQDRAAVRIETSLNQKEQEFLGRRRNTVLQNLQKLQIQCTQDDVPNIAILGSGGGERAMVALLGSLVQLGEAGLLDCVLYLSGVSGSTWCMASLYQEPDWSSKLETLKKKIVQRLGGPPVSLKDRYAKLKKYYYDKEFFSLTDVWAVLVVTGYVKEIDEHKLSDQWKHNNKDPFPIYTVIDKHCKQKNNGDPWVEITPHEAGYSLTGAFVDACNFGCQFQKGCKKNLQNEFDMLYMQALCGSALADEVEIKKALWQKIKDFFQKENVLEEVKKDQSKKKEEAKANEEAPAVGKDLIAGIKLRPKTVLQQISDQSQKVFSLKDLDKSYQVLMGLVDMNIALLNGTDTSALDESIRRGVNDLIGGKTLWEKLRPADKEGEKQFINRYMMDVCNKMRDQIKIWPFDVWTTICIDMIQWIWGRNYNFLHDVNNQAVPPTLLETETRDFIDAGLLNNSPYFAVLRKDRNIDLIISLDFSEGDPFLTVKEAANTCKKLKIPFPEVNISDEDVKKPKDFYVFKGQNAPTVIHIPLFNQINCGDKLEDWRKNYSTFQLSYTAQKVKDLVEVAGKNIRNNREKLKEEIRAAVGQKRSRCKH